MTVKDPHVEETATSAVDSIKSEATEQASRLAGTVKDQVTRREQNLRVGIATRAESVAEGLRKAKSEIDPESSVAVMFDRAADSVSGLADSLNSTDPAQMLGDVRRFARRQPGAFLGLSALAGFAAIRFLRAGSTTSSDTVGTSGHSTSSMTRQATSPDRAVISPAGTASQNRPTGTAAMAPQTGGISGTTSGTAPTLSGSRNTGGSHD